ncbi:MAG TPA: glycerophosphoryl diester phosphodiesterase membrane domain-containing protein [Dongiaceae bacterium]|jgi:hypothetical protein|nr:glycerophosphoryl diester phosphodiesterase membrane domain-containing protein [Dongiaceae bacterium]
MAQDSIAAGDRFEVGRVLSTSVAVFLRNIGPFSIIVLLIGIPYILVSLWSLSSVGDLQAAAETGSLPPSFWGMIGVGFIILLLTNTLSQSAINYGTFQDLRGQKASFGDCLGRGLAMLPRVIVGAVLATIGITVGFALFFVPGLILLLMWWVFIPVMIVEGVGVTEAFGRSRALTKGHRWGIFGLLIIVGIVQAVVQMIVGFIGGALGTIATEVLDLVVTFGFTAFTAVLCAVGYYYLRSEKDGIVIDDIARVFD